MKEKQKLTAKQASLYDYIKVYWRSNGMPPLLSEMCRDLKFCSKGSPSRLLDELERKGWIKRDRSPRGIKLL